MIIPKSFLINLCIKDFFSPQVVFKNLQKYHIFFYLSML